MNDDIFDKPSEAEIDKIHEVDLKEKMETFYIDYAMSVIASRALPDVREAGTETCTLFHDRTEQWSRQAAS